MLASGSSAEHGDLHWCSVCHVDVTDKANNALNYLESLLKASCREAHWEYLSKSNVVLIKDIAFFLLDLLIKGTYVVLI